MNKKLYEDLEFPSNKYVWMRAKDIHPNAEFIVNGACEYDIEQGALGDCWLAATMISLVKDEKAFNRVVLPGQTFKLPKYNGEFYFKFYEFDRWIKIKVDDFLPTRNGRLTNLRSEDVNEFWSALLEKAYAKLYGDYSKLKGGFFSNAALKFTGNIFEFINFSGKSSLELYKLMIECFARSKFMSCCSFPTNHEMKMNVEMKKLVTRHAYSILGIDEIEGIDDKEIDDKEIDENVKLVLHNPWGIESREKGSKFTIKFSLFKKCFNHADICILNSEEMKFWKEKSYYDRWIIGSSAGGSENFETFSMNHQYIIELTKPATVIFALKQNQNKRREKSILDIGFSIYEIRINGLRKFEICRYRKLVENAIRRSNFPAGRYLIIPSTYLPNLESEYLLRIFTEDTEIEFYKLNDEHKYAGDFEMRCNVKSNHNTYSNMAKMEPDSNQIEFSIDNFLPNMIDKNFLNKLEIDYGFWKFSIENFFDYVKQLKFKNLDINEYYENWKELFTYFYKFIESKNKVDFMNAISEYLDLNVSGTNGNSSKFLSLVFKKDCLEKWHKKNNQFQ